MTNVKHTPEPWILERNACDDREPYSHSITDSQGNEIAEVFFVDSEPESDANARLIAAAPDLLKVLEAASDWIDAQLGEPRLEIQAKVQAAIAKAKGNTL